MRNNYFTTWSVPKLPKYDTTQIKDLIESLVPRKEWDPSITSLQNLKRIAATASIIPKAQKSGARLVDIGGRVYWIPIYAKLLGYEHITMLGRSGGAFFENCKIPGQGEYFVADTLEADAELDCYPMGSESVDCVVCFDLLEHLAGDPMHLVAESNRILRKGGHFCLTTPNVIYFANLVRFLFGGHPFGWSVFTDSYADRHNREYAPDEVRRLLEAGGFSLELLQTGTCNPVQDKRVKILGYSLSLIPALTGHVSLKLRGAEIRVCATKVSDTVERYPHFLYDLFGAERVAVRIKNYSHLTSVSEK